MIEVKHLTKLYGDYAAVDDLSFTVEDGTIYGFLGVNGAGKTTTMNIMTGYLSPSDGEVLINGHDILDEPEEAKKTLGYLPEIPPVYPDMTVYEYLDFAAELKGVPGKQRAAEIERVAEELELQKVIKRLIRNLSKGYRQRVGFAQALLGDPETLILDEPTVGLDPKQIIEIRELIKRLGKSHTVILSSHILSEVSEICDRVLIIDQGRLIACDTPENLAAARERSAVLRIHSEGSVEQVRKALLPVAGEEELLNVYREHNETCAEITLTAETGDIRASVSRALFQANLMILEMKTERESLENIFLELTADIAPVSDVEEEPEE
ncbi:MAG: ABC transporter ATP-binding protein [Lachnospiraceae bacterium]|nr:ABC transporter ATP-binding protein [Lachnospiraceae bacterium]